MKKRILISLLIAADVIIFLWAMYNVMVYMQQGLPVNVVIYLIVSIILSVNIGVLMKCVTIKKVIA